MRYPSNDKRVLFAAAILAGGLALQAAPLRADDLGTSPAATEETIVTVVPLAYCHTRIPVGNDKPSGNDDPQLTPDWQDSIDYYGACDQADMDDTRRQMRETSADD